MKKVLFILLMAMGIAFTSLAVYASDEIRVAFDCRYMDFDVQPQMIQDRVMVPLRGIFEKLGATVDWNENDQTINVSKNDTHVSLQMDQTKATINGNSYDLDVPPTLVDGRTLVPIRFVSEGLGAIVSWNESSKIAFIYSDEYLKDMNMVKLNIMLNHRYSNKVVSSNDDYIAVKDNEYAINTNLGSVSCMNTVVKNPKSDEFMVSTAINMYTVNQLLNNKSEQEKTQFYTDLESSLYTLAEFSVKATNGKQALWGAYIYRDGNDELQFLREWQYTIAGGLQIKDNWISR